MNNISQLNDLASVDMCFAEFMEENGINPIPCVCDGLDTGILDTDNKTLSKLFVTAKNNMQLLVDKLNNERTTENNGYIDIIIDNFKKKIALIDSNMDKLSNSDFSFYGLYIGLKSIQNELGINLSSPELNILTFTDESMDLDAKKGKVLEQTKKLKAFMQESDKANKEFVEKEQQSIKQTEKSKEKIQEKPKEKQQVQELEKLSELDLDKVSVTEKTMIKEKIKQKERRRQIELQNTNHFRFGGGGRSM